MSADEEASDRRATGKGLGLVATTALVVGGVIGTGIFTAPAEVAQFGWVVYPAFAIVTFGAILLALTFASLARRYPASGGPAYGYAREAFGEFTGFLSAWGYWIQGWTGQATIAVAGAGYAASLFGVATSGLPLLLLALAVLWIPVLPNLVGTKLVGDVQVVTTVLKLLPLLAVGIAGILLFKSGSVGTVEPSVASSPIAAIAPAAVLLLFSFLGMEGASVASNRVTKSQSTIPKAVVFGVIICAVVYLVGILGVQMTLPQGTLANSSAPFADAGTAIVGASWAGAVISVAAVISALGALNGWTMVNGEMVNSAARDGLFPKATASAPGTIPVRAIFVNTVLATILVFSASSDGFLALFTTLALLSTFAYVWTYLLSMAAQVYWLVTGNGEMPRRVRAREAVIAFGAMFFSIWMLAATGYSTVYDGIILIIVGIPVYLVDRWWRAREARKSVLAESASGEPRQDAAQ